MKSKKRKTVKTISAEELDAKFERGEDLSDYMDWESATKTVRINMPVRLIKKLNELAEQVGIPISKLITTAVEDFISKPLQVDIVPIEKKDFDKTVKKVFRKHKKAMDELK